MQDRYVGDIGDFVKYSLLNALSVNKKLGMAWYRFPDEAHNADGKHTSYLNAPELWRSKDPYVFDRLRDIISKKDRSIAAVRKHQTILASKHFFETLECDHSRYQLREQWRRDWFSRQIKHLNECDIIFADPDNGLCLDENYKYCNKKMWKRLPLSEAQALAQGRSAVFYHHNSHYKGGHLAEIIYWLSKLPQNSFAIRVRYASSRTFFMVNADENTLQAAQAWSERFDEKVSLIIS